MTSVFQSIRSRDGLAATFELYADGFTRRDVATAVRSRAMVRVRQGWFALPETHRELREAARVGGRLTCVSALRLHGVWVPPDSRLHVALPQRAARPRSRTDMRRRLADYPHGVRVHWVDHTSSHRLLLPTEALLIDAIGCLRPEWAAAVSDSALRNRLIGRDAFARIIHDLSPTRVRALALVDGVCESGIETIWWTRMHRHRLSVRRQVSIAGVGRVDFLVGDRLVVEVDGAAYHVDPERFDADRRRDAALSILGFRVLRFSYRQVLFEWETEVEPAVLAAVVRGDHHAA